MPLLQGRLRLRKITSDIIMRRRYLWHLSKLQSQDQPGWRSVLLTLQNQDQNQRQCDEKSPWETERTRELRFPGQMQSALRKPSIILL
jgi:hypothetical protein